MTASTLKVNFSPYLIDIVLLGTVDSLRHKAKVRTGVLKITLFKALDNQNIWGSLEVSGDGDKELLRQSSSLKQQVIEKKLLEQRKDRKVADERHSVRKQMALEEAERSRLEGKKEEEKHNAEEEMYATFSKLQSSSLPPDDKKSNNNDKLVKKSDNITLSDGTEDYISDDIEDVEEINSIDDPVKKNHVDSTINDVEAHDNEYYNGAATRPETDDSDLKYIPPPRSTISDSRNTSSSTVNINFTPRVFPTPMRESTQANEEDWIAKNRKHLKKHGTLGKNIPKGVQAPKRSNRSIFLICGMIP